MLLSRNRVPDSMAEGMENDRDSKGAHREGQREVNWEESIDNAGGSDNYQSIPRSVWK